MRLSLMTNIPINDKAIKTMCTQHKPALGILDIFLLILKSMTDLSIKVRIDSTAGTASLVARGGDLIIFLLTGVIVDFAINFNDWKG